MASNAVSSVKDNLMDTLAMLKIIFFMLLLCAEFVFPLNFQVWGPGISPHRVILPARYFFIKSWEDNESFRIDQNKLSVKINGESASGGCRLWQQVLNIKDNSFIVRYRLYEECYNFNIELKYDGEHLGNSPYSFTGPIYNENCNCPVDKFESWRINYGCPKNIQQIHDDMNRFKDVNMTEVLKYMREKYNSPGSMSYCFYSIKNNELFRKCFGKHVGFHIFSDAIFLSVLRKVKLPDQSFIINLGDWPLIKITSNPVPIFSWCGSDDTLDIVLPTYDLTESTLENMGRVMLDMLSVQGNIDTIWNEKIPQGFWRGRDSREERLKLIDISKQFPNLYNVSLTNFFFFRDKEHIYGPKVPHVSFFKFFDFKYQISIDGTVAAYRLPYLLIGDSVVLKQDSPYYEHFYKQLKPGVHFIPFKRDLSDLTSKIQWAIENDDQARVISLNGRKFAQENLMPVDIICYYSLALNEWSQRILGPVEILDGMEKVIDKENSEQKCKCTETLNRSHEEL